MSIKDLDLSKEDIEKFVSSYIFNERNRAIVLRKWLDDIKFEPLAEEFDISTVHAKRIVHYAEMKLREKLNAPTK